MRVSLLTLSGGETFTVFLMSFVALQNVLDPFVKLRELIRPLFVSYLTNSKLDFVNDVIHDCLIDWIADTPGLGTLNPEMKDFWTISNYDNNQAAI